MAAMHQLQLGNRAVAMLSEILALSLVRAECRCSDSFPDIAHHSSSIGLQGSREDTERTPRGAVFGAVVLPLAERRPV